MAKTNEELQALKQEYEALNMKLEELSNDELAEITCGVKIWDIAVKLKELTENEL